MERLTEEIQIGPFASLKDKAEAVPGAFGTYDCLYAHMVAVTRLKEYEDVMPLERVQELAQAEKDGRLVVLPCKVGDAVYFPVEGRWDAATIDRIKIDSNGVMFGWVQYDVGPEVNELWADGYFTADDIGKTAFLTHEEAEAALGKGEEG